MTASTTAPRIVGPAEGAAVQLGLLRVRHMIGAGDAGGGFSLVEHPIEPRGLAAPLHRHANEDEYSFVLEGRMGAKLGDHVVYAEPGDLVFKPRRQWHTFWNAADAPCRILEIIAPGGFEAYFDEVAELLASPGFTPEQIGPVAARYGLELDPSSIAGLCEQFGVRFGAF